MNPDETALMRTSSSAHSAASVLVSVMTPDLAAPYADMPGTPNSPAMLATFTTLPPPSRRASANARVTAYVQ